MQTPDKNIRDIRLEDIASGEDEARLFKILLDHAPFAAFAIEGEHFCCYVNHAAEKLTGYSRDELLRMDYSDIIHPDFRELIVSRFKARIEGSTAPSRYEIKIITGKSEERWIDLNATTIDFAGERLILATALDISERKRYEESLLLSDFTIEKSAESIYWVAQDGRIYRVNEAACKELGYTKEELQSLRVWDIDPIYTKETFDALTRELKKKNQKTFETTHITKAGQWIPVEIQANSLRYDGHEFSCAFCRDIAERKRSEEALRESEARLAKSQKIAHLGNYDWDIAHNTDEWSDEMFYILGIRPGGVKPSLEAFMRFVYPDDRRIVNKHLDDMFKKHVFSGGYEIRIVRPDGSILWTRLDGEFTCDGSGKITRLFGTIMDITEQKRAEEESVRLKRQAELYLDLMSHDITNMNQVLLGNLEMMEAMRETGAIDKALIDDSIDAIHRSTRMISNVKKLTQLQAGRVPLKDVDVGKILSKVKARYSSESNKPVSINYTPAESCIVRAGDSLVDVFDNLVDNAIRHSKGPATIDMGVDKVVADGHLYYRISVADTGPGITDDLKRKIFMTSAELAGKTQRRGFGLYMVRTLVDYYHGKVWVEDRVEGDHTKGARFVVLLPAAEK